ncbi:MAG: hypothetical protein H0S85_06605 [Desulfovibrionaceae bacterium]|jgi:hypothetical protein|nr:hypothetical protein [Desulfovibrionaceae bacterium]
MIKRILKTLMVALPLALLLIGQAHAAEVIQGKCLTYDKAAKTLSVEEYDINFSKEYPYGHPTGIESVVGVAEAQIGIEPEAGDILRIAFVAEGDAKKALKIMNVSKQDLRKK